MFGSVLGVAVGRVLQDRFGLALGFLLVLHGGLLHLFTFFPGRHNREKYRGRPWRWLSLDTTIVIAVLALELSVELTRCIRALAAYDCVHHLAECHWFPHCRQPLGLGQFSALCPCPSQLKQRDLVVLRNLYPVGNMLCANLKFKVFWCIIAVRGIVALRTLMESCNSVEHSIS